MDVSTRDINYLAQELIDILESRGYGPMAISLIFEHGKFIMHGAMTAHITMESMG